MNRVSLYTVAGTPIAEQPAEMALDAIANRITKSGLYLEFKIPFDEKNPCIYWLKNQEGMRKGRWDINYIWTDSSGLVLNATITSEGTQQREHKVSQRMLTVRVQYDPTRIEAHKKAMARMLLPLFDANPEPMPKVDGPSAEKLAAIEAKRAEIERKARESRELLEQLAAGRRDKKTEPSKKIYWTLPVGGTRAHSVDTDKFGIHPKTPVWKSVDEETEPMRKAMLEALIQTPPLAFLRIFGVPRDAVIRFLSHGFPPPSVDQIIVLSQKMSVGVDSIQRYMWNNYYHELNLDELVERTGQAGAVFYVDAKKDVLLIKRFNEEPGSLGEALWVKRKIRGKTIEKAALEINGVSNDLLGRIEKMQKASLVLEQRQALADYLGITVETFDAQWPQYIRVMPERAIRPKTEKILKPLPVRKPRSVKEKPAHSIVRVRDYDLFLQEIAVRQGHPEVNLSVNSPRDISLLDRYAQAPDTLGEALWFARKSKGLFLEEMSKASGVSFRVWGDLESLKLTQVYEDQQNRICTFLGITVDEWENRWPQIKVVSRRIKAVDDDGESPIHIGRKIHFSVEAAQADRRHLVNARTYGIYPKAPLWHTTRDEPHPLRQKLMQVLDSKNDEDLRKEKGPSRAQIWSFLYHQLPAPRQDIILKLAHVTELKPEDFYTYLFENYFHALGIEGIAKRQGVEGAVFYIDYTVDAPLIGRFNASPGTLGEALWFARKRKDESVMEAAGSIHMDHKRWRHIEEGKTDSILPEVRKRLSDYLGLEQQDFDKKYPYAVSVVRRKYTVDEAKREARHLVDNEKFGIHPKEPEWAHREEEPNILRRRLRDRLHKYKPEELEARFAVTRDHIWDLLTHALPYPKKSVLIKIAEMVRLTVEDVYRYIFENYYHEFDLKKIAERNGHPDATFYLNPFMDVEKIRRFNAFPGSLAEVLWFHRRRKNLSTRDAGTMNCIDYRRWTDMERGKRNHLMKRDIDKLAEFTGISKDEFKARFAADKPKYVVKLKPKKVAVVPDRVQERIVEERKKEGNSSDLTQKYGISPSAPVWLDRKDETNTVRQALYNLLANNSWEKLYEMDLNPVVIWNFLGHRLPAPKQKTLKLLATVTGLSEDAFYRYMAQTYFHELPLADIAQRQGHPDVVFYINTLIDVPLIKSFKERTGSLGEMLWFARKARGLDVETIAPLARMEPARWRKMEEGHIIRLFPRDYVQIAQALGISWEDFQRKVIQINTGTVAEESGVSGNNQGANRGIELSSSLARKAVGTLTHADVSAAINRFYSEKLGLSRKLPPQTSAHLMNMRFKKVLTEDIGVFLALYGKKFTAKERQDFWLGIFGEEMAKALPNFNPEDPALTLPHGFTLKDLFSFSIPHFMSEQLFDYRNTSETLGDLLGVGNLRARLFASMDYPIQSFGHFEPMAELFGITPDLLYILNNPWVLLAIPLVDQNGKRILSEKNYPSEELLTELKEYLETRRYGRSYMDGVLAAAAESKGLVQQAGEVKDVFYKRVLVEFGFPESNLRNFTHNQGLPTNDELLLAIRLLPGINARLLLEGYRIGELSVMLGRNKDGSIDWQEPLKDLADIPEYIEAAVERIYEKLHQENENRESFWQRYDLNIFRYPKGRREALYKGLTPRQIFTITDLAQKAEVEALKRRDVYWYYYGDFIRQFVGEVEQPIAEAQTAPPQKPAGSSVVAKAAGAIATSALLALSPVIKESPSVVQELPLIDSATTLVAAEEPVVELAEAVAEPATQLVQAPIYQEPETPLSLIAPAALTAWTQLAPSLSFGPAALFQPVRG